MSRTSTAKKADFKFQNLKFEIEGKGKTLGTTGPERSGLINADEPQKRLNTEDPPNRTAGGHGEKT